MLTEVDAKIRPAEFSRELDTVIMLPCECLLLKMIPKSPRLSWVASNRLKLSLAHHASDGEQALRLMRTEHFDLLIVDLMLPGIDGLTLIEQLRREKIKSPVLILSRQTVRGRPCPRLANGRTTI